MIKSLNSFNFSGFDRDCEEDDLEGRLRQHRQRQSQPDLTTQEHHRHLIQKSVKVVKKITAISFFHYCPLFIYPYLPNDLLNDILDDLLPLLWKQLFHTGMDFQSRTLIKSDS